MEISDVDPERIVYKRPSDGKVVHLRKDCRHIADMDVWAGPAGGLFQSLRICTACDPNHNHAEAMRKASAGKSKGEGVRILEDADPEDWP